MQTASALAFAPRGQQLGGLQHNVARETRLSVYSSPANFKLTGGC